MRPGGDAEEENGTCEAVEVVRDEKVGGCVVETWRWEECVEGDVGVGDDDVVVDPAVLVSIHYIRYIRSSFWSHSRQPP